jgi:DNA-binding winged helix-turn-helix (wHTH) protein/tetratricopeptide (TPR) repeat protein/TolB-like protein
MPPVESGNPEPERVSQSSSAADGSKFASRVCFGLYEVDLHAHELRKGGLRLKIPHQSFQILAMLLERPSQVVSREDLRRKLWPGDVFVNFEASLNSAVQRLRSALQDTSLEPRYIETLPKVGYRFIASVDSVTPVPRIPVPDEEPQSVATLDSAELPSVDATPDESLTVLPVKGRNWPYWAAAVLLLVLFVAYVGYRYSRRNQRVPGAQAHPSLVIPSSLTRRSVAVMGFTNASGNARDVWLSTAFTEMLATELAAGDHLRTVPEEDVARAKLELSLTNKDSYGGNTLTKIRKDIGCDYVVAGSYLSIGQAGTGRVRLDARVQDAVTGDTVASFAVIGSQSDLFDLASRAGEQLRAKLGVGTLTSTEAEETKLALPSNPEAARLYSDGLAKLRVYDDVVASDLFERTIRLQPDYSPAYSALASARRALGYDAEATSAARKAMDLAGNLPQQARLQTEARYHEMKQDWTRAVEIYSRLQRSYPENLDYGLDLASAQLNMGNSAEAAATIAALRNLPPPERDDPRIDLTEAKIASDLANYKREQTLAVSAVGKSESSGARLLLARAKLLEGWALDNLGNFSSSIDAYAVAQRVFAESGNLRDSATALMDVSSVLAKQGDLAGATRRTEQALGVFRKTGDQASLAAALSNLGEIYGSEGELPKAEHLVREALTIFNKLNMKTKQDILTYNLAELLRLQGKFHEAKDMLKPLAELSRSGANKSLLGVTMETLGSIAETQGEMATAVRLYQEAASILKDAGDKTEYAGAERSLGRAFLMEGDLVSANQPLSEALSVDRGTGAKADTALDQIALAEVASAQGSPVDMGTLRSAIDELRLQRLADDEIEAKIVLAREILRQGKTDEAAKMLREMTALSAKSYDPTIRFDVALATAHLRGAQHRLNEASRTIRPALQSAVAMGCVRCQMEARLELGEIEIQMGNAEQGHAQLHELADEAGRRGFRLIAERAAAGERN